MNLRVILAAICLILSACATMSPSALWTEPVTVKRAAFLWRHAGGTLSGDAVVTHDQAGNVSIRLLKNLPRPLLEVTSSASGEFFADGPLAGRAWSGSPNRAPDRLSLWTAACEAWRAALSAREGQQEVHTPAFRAAVWKENGSLRELTVSSNDNGQLIRLVLER